MSSLADALASLEAANACIDAIAGSYPRAFPNDRTSRPIDLTSETARVRSEQETLQRAMTSENDAPEDPRREKNFYVAPGGVLVNAALVPEPDPVPKPKPRMDPPPRASHPPNQRARVGDETHSAEARAVQWLREQVMPLLPKQPDPLALFGRTSLGLRTFPLDDDDLSASHRPTSSHDAAKTPYDSESVGGFHVVDATGASVLRVLLEVREVPSSEGVGTDRTYGPSRPERWGREQWTFSRVNRAARLPGPCVVLLLGADGASRNALDEAYDANENDASTSTRNERIENALKNAYVAWCVPKENALALRDTLKPYVVVSRSDATCKWRAFRVASKNEDTPNAADALASTLARHIDASVRSRGQSVSVDVPLPGFLRVKKQNIGSNAELEPTRRRGALLDALGTWSHPTANRLTAEKQPPNPPGSAAPAMAPALDGLPSATAGSVATLRLDYDLGTSFRVLHLSAIVHAEASWDIAAATLRKPGRAPTSSFYRNARAGGFGAPYESTDFDVLFLHAGQASAEGGCFVIPMNDLVARLHVLGAFERRGKTYACDASTVQTELRLMVPTHASRWRGVAPEAKPPRGGDVSVVRGQFVDARGAWALDYFVAYPASPDEVAGAVDEVKRLLLGEKPRWDGEWTHPAFRT